MNSLRAKPSFHVGSFDTFHLLIKGILEQSNKEPSFRSRTIENPFCAEFRSQVSDGEGNRTAVKHRDIIETSIENRLCV